MAETISRRHWLERLPKVELHLHLESAIPYSALWRRIQKYGGDIERLQVADQRRVNTDDPKMFRKTLADEFEMLMTRLHFSASEIRQLILEGIQSSWLSDDRKKRMTDLFRQDALWQDEPF